MNAISAKTRLSERAPARRPSKGLSSLDFAIFIIPCLQCIEVKVVGVLNGADVALLIAFLYLGFRGKLRIATPAARTLILVGLLWLASQIVTDIVRHTAFADYARGWSIIGLTVANFAVLYVLLYGRPSTPDALRVGLGCWRHTCVFHKP